MHNKIASIILSSPQSKTIGDIFIAQPSASKEDLAGKLFVLVEIESNPNALKIIDFLINNINHNYYNNEKIILRERIHSLRIEHIFEISLAKTNKDFGEFLKREKIKLSPKSFNASIGIIDKNEIHFANTGKNKALLIYKHKEELKYKSQKTGQIKVSYKITNVAEKENNDKEFDKDKAFSNVISGNIPKNGYFLFTNEALPEYISHKQLVQILTKLQPQGASEQIKNTLTDINSYISFYGILIKNTVGMEFAERTEPVRQISTQNSINELNDAEEQTEKLLSAQGIVNSRKWIDIMVSFIKKIKPKLQKKRQRTIELKEKIIFSRRKSIISLKKIKKVTIGLLFYTFRVLKLIIKTIVDKQERKKVIKKFADAKNWFKILNKKHKILLVATVCFVVLFISSISYTNVQNKKQAEIANLNKLILTIEQKQNQIDAHLLYNNEKKAKEILEETKTLIEDLNKLNTENNLDYSKYTDKENLQISKIRKVVNVEAKEIANFSNISSNANTNNLTLIDNKLFSGDIKENTIYEIDLSDNLVTGITGMADVGGQVLPAVGKDKDIYYLNNKNLTKLETKTNKTSSFEIEKQSGITSTSGFNGRLYVLDSSAGQIYKYTKTESSFTNKQPWLNRDADFSSAVDIDIDGHIYVLEKDGSVLKYLKGAEEELYMDSVEPEIVDARKIIVSADLEFIYILEPKNKRLIIFDKTGEFLLQYTATEFSDLKDFAVDEINGKIYVLNGNVVYAFNGKHFN